MEDVDWINLAQDRICSALVNAVKNFRITQGEGNIMSN